MRRLKIAASVARSAAVSTSTTASLLYHWIPDLNSMLDPSSFAVMSARPWPTCGSSATRNIRDALMSQALLHSTRSRGSACDQGIDTGSRA
jgi:hypothetical protein